MRKAIENARGKIQRFADLARGAASAVADYVRSHGRSMFPVAPINFLNHSFPPIAAGKIEIDIRPAFAALVQEPFENQIVANGIDGSDPQAVTNRAVRRAAAA